MICFEVSINGEKMATSGIPGFAVLTAIVTWVHRKGEPAGRTDVTMTGLDSNAEPGEHLRWRHAEVGPGDEVLVRIVEDAAVDPPERRKSAKPTKADQIRRLRRELQYVEKRQTEIAKELERLEPADHGELAKRAAKPTRKPAKKSSARAKK